MRILMIFLDGIGLGDDDPSTNPFAAANTPTLIELAAGNRWLRATGKQEGHRSIFLPVDPQLGVPGRPQSATGQATILSGRNFPKLLGEHYGPKPNEKIRTLIPQDNLFITLTEAGKSAIHVEAYPPAWHNAINRGKRLMSSYQLAASSAGIKMLDAEDLREGRALSGDWTGEGWSTHLNIHDIPILTPYEAGQSLIRIAKRHDFSFFSHWHTDIVGHRGPFEAGVALLETFDHVMRGVMDGWRDDEGLIIITSDHGNLELQGDRRHTNNLVPAVIIGDAKAAFADGLTDLSDFAPRITDFLLSDGN